MKNEPLSDAALALVLAELVSGLSDTAAEEFSALLDTADSESIEDFLRANVPDADVIMQNALLEMRARTNRLDN
jgi:hypothetical protein